MLEKHRLRKRGLLFFIGVSIVFLLPSTRAAGEEPWINSLTITKTENGFWIHFKMEGCFTKEIEESILNGLPITFTSSIKIFQKREHWFDKELDSSMVKHTMKYDTLKKEFRVSIRQNDEEIVTTTQDFEKAKKRMSVFKKRINPFMISDRYSQYYLKAKVIIKEVTLPFYLHRVLFFVSLWNVETDWIEKPLSFQ